MPIPDKTLLKALVLCGVLCAASGCAGSAATAIGMIGSELIKTITQSGEDKDKDLPSGPSVNPERIAETNRDLAVAYIRKGNYHKALDRLDKASEHADEDAVAFGLRALAYQGLDERDQAEKYYGKALAEDANNSSILNNYGQYLCSLGDYKQAVEKFMRVLGDPYYESPEIAYTNLAICKRAEGDLERAHEYLRKAYEIEPTLPQILTLLCELELEKGDYQQTKVYLREYEELYSHSAKTAWVGVQLERVMGDKDALDSYKLLLRKKFTDSVEARVYLNQEPAKATKQDRQAKKFPESWSHPRQSFSNDPSKERVLLGI